MDTPHAGHRPAALVGGALLAASGALMVALMVVGSGYTFADGPAEVAERLASGEGPRRIDGLYQWAGSWTVAWAGFAAGVAALGAAIRRDASFVSGALASGAAVVLAAGAALRAVDHAVLVAVADRWPDVEAGVVRSDDPIHAVGQVAVAVQEAGYSMVLVALLLLAAAIATAPRVTHPAVSVVPAVLAVVLLSQLFAGGGTSPAVIGVGLPVLATAVLAGARFRLRG